MGKSVSEIATEIGVSPQAVRDKIKKMGLQSALQTHNKAFVIDENSEMAIKRVFESGAKNFAKSLQSEKDTLQSSLQDDDNSIVALLKDNLTLLKTQLEEKDRQLAVKDEQLAEKDSHIKDLTETVKTQAQSINASCHNELAETLQRKLLVDETESAINKERLSGIADWWKRKFGKSGR